MLPCLLHMLEWGAGPTGAIYGLPPTESSFAGPQWSETTEMIFAGSYQTCAASRWAETTFLERK